MLFARFIEFSNGHSDNGRLHSHVSDTPSDPSLREENAAIVDSARSGSRHGRVPRRSESWFSCGGHGAKCDADRAHSYVERGAECDWKAPLARIWIRCFLAQLFDRFGQDEVHASVSPLSCPQWLSGHLAKYGRGGTSCISWRFCNIRLAGWQIAAVRRNSWRQMAVVCAAVLCCLQSRNERSSSSDDIFLDSLCDDLRVTRI